MAIASRLAPTNYSVLLGVVAGAWRGGCRLFAGHLGTHDFRLTNPVPCGSQPAGDGGVSACINVECEMAIASRLAPTNYSVLLGVVAGAWRGGCRLFAGHLGTHDFRLTNPVPCGSQPAGDGGVSACINVECEMAIASRLAPTNYSVLLGVVAGAWRGGCRLFAGHLGTHDFRLTNPVPCGSQPAGDGGVSACINVECEMAIASRLAPTNYSVLLGVVAGAWRGGCRLFAGHLGTHDFRLTNPVPCGSQPAGDGGVSACINVECEMAIASRLAHTGFNHALKSSYNFRLTTP